MINNDSDQLALRITDQETARVVAVLGHRGNVVGAGCLVTSDTVITCKHVVEFALGRNKRLKNGAIVSMVLVGVVGAPPLLWGSD